jgi:hypothetical protein
VQPISDAVLRMARSSAYERRIRKDRSAQNF